MYPYLFLEFIRLSTIYNDHLSVLEDKVFNNIDKMELSTKHKSLIELYKINKSSIDNCMAIMTKVRELQV